MTEKLYYREPSLLAFDAKVLAVKPEGAAWAVVLDRTCFYPGGGGQPADRGTLGGLVVTEVREEGGEILHVLPSPLPVGPVRGELDAVRRLDFMARHTGQHILSRALMDNGGHETVSVHFGEEATDVEVASREVPAADVAAAEGEANRVIKENRRVVVHETDAAGAARFPLRKPAPDEPVIRIVEVDSYDWSPCGGVHAAAAGEVSLIKVVSLERIRGRVRLRALMGRGAIDDYGRKTVLVDELTRLLTCGEPDIRGRVAELLERDRAGARELRRLRSSVAAAEAAEAAAHAAEVGGLLFVLRVLDGGGAEALKAFTDAVLAAPGRFSAAACPTADGFQWALGHSAGNGVDLAALAAPVLSAFGARGGGKGNRMQGAAAGPERAQGFLDAVREALSLRS